MAHNVWFWYLYIFIDYRSYINMIKEYYIKTIKILKEETNNENETTYFIEGKISEEGKPFKDCLLIWDGKMEDN